MTSMASYKEMEERTTLLYYGGDGNFYMLKCCPYVKQQFRRKRLSESKPRQNLHSTQSLKREKRIIRKPTKYTSFSPDFSLLSVSKQKKRKEKKDAFAVRFSDGKKPKKQAKVSDTLDPSSPVVAQGKQQPLLSSSGSLKEGERRGDVLKAPNGQTEVKNNSEVVEESAERGAMNNASMKTSREIASKINLSEEEKKLSLLRNALYLDIESQTDSEDQECLVRNIFVNRGGGANALEKLFAFIVILKEEFVADNPSKLWRKIKDKVLDWMKLLTKEKREDFQRNEDSESFLHSPSNENVSLRGKGKVKQVFLDQLSDIDFQKKVFVVLVDKQLFKSRQTARYLFKMDNNKQPKHSFVLKLNENESKYHASFHLEDSSQDLVYSKHFKGLLEGVGDLLTQPPLGPPEEPYPQSSRQVQTLRPFGDKVSSTFFYQKGFVLNAWETGPKDLMDPVHEFKLCHIGKLDESNLLDKFLFETLRFACGCLNERTNGTIHFGVADEERKQAGNCEPRQVVGCRVSSKPTLSKKLTEYIDKCFVGDSRGIVRNCIRPPLFIPVKGDEVSSDESVIEVDIEPQITLCKGKIFMTNFNCLIRGGNKEAAYIRHGSESKVIKNCKEFRDVAERLPALDELRKKQERKNMFVKHLCRKVVILFNENRVRLQSLRHLVIHFLIDLISLYIIILVSLMFASLKRRKKLNRSNNGEED